MDKKNNAGAIASNAGDDFHLIWACKKLLEILKPNSELTAVSVEGPTWEDSICIEDEEKLYSIDLAEYYDGDSFESAHRVVFSQLKYSTYQMEKPWTAANLCASTNGSNSIIRRLADTYNGFCGKYENVQKKLILKLVSNRKLQTNFSDHIDECMAILRKKKYKRMGDLVKRLSPKCKEDINKLYETSKLSSTSFIEFLLLLNFDECGTDIRSIHRAEIIKQLGSWNISNLRSRYNSLIMHLREMMLPEKSIGFPMDRDYVLAALETSIYQAFPAPIKIDPPLNVYIERNFDSEIRGYIQKNQNKTICLQAAAGVGKTTFVNHMQNILPKESIAILYDCYGGGSFLQHGERRHLTEVAIPQICNTLATECGTEWMIGRLSKEYEYWRFLNERLEKAVSYVRQQNPSAIIAIIIDAADNSMVAANYFKEECFLQGLLNESLPDGVRVIVTTRTERRYLIPFGDELKIFDLPPFELSGSSQHIRSVFQDVTNLQCEEFHILTDKNPRLQTYMLSESSSVDEMLSHMKPEGKTMDSLFKEFIDGAQRQYNSIVDIEILFSTLINLPRPIPVDVLYEICDITIDALVSISVECRRGFYIEGSFIFLKDEDFETYLRNCYGDNQEAIETISEYMYLNRTSNSYCSRYVHIFIDKANSFELLVDIALNEKVDGSDLGIAQVNQIMKQRIQYALKRQEMNDPQNRLLACKLVYRLIDCNTNEDALKEFIFNAPDEAVLYCDEISLYNIFHTDSNDFDSLGKAALVFSHFPNYHTDSQQYIKSYLASIKAYYNKNKDYRGYHYQPSIIDIINIAEAMLRLGEQESAIRLICGWDPRKVATKHVYQIFIKLLKYDYHELYEPLLSKKWRSPNKLAIVCAYISLGKEPPKIYIDYLLKLFKRMSKIPDSRFSKGQLLLFSEYLMHFRNTRDTVTDLLDKFSVEIEFSSLISIYDKDGKVKLSNALRYYALNHICKGGEINSADFWKSKENSDQSQSEDNKKSMTKMVDFLLPIYLFRLTCIQGEYDDSFLSNCSEILSKIDHGSWSFYSYDKHQLLESGLLVFVESISLVQNLKSKELKELIAKTLQVTNTSPEFKLELLKKLIRNKRAYLSVLAVLEQIDTIYERYPASAKEMLEVYLGCAQIGKKIDKGLGEKYFDKAIECTKGLDYESYRKLYLYRELADNISSEGIDNDLIAHKIIRLSEDFCCKMGDTKNFPYDESIGAASLLSPKNIWGSLCRLDDRDDYDGFSLHDTIPIVLNTLLDADKISLEDTIALMGLLLPDLSSDYNDLVDIVLMKLTQLTPSQQKPILEILINDLLYNIPMDKKQYRCHCMIKYLDANVTSPELNTDKIRALDSFLQKINSKNYEYDTNNVVIHNEEDIKHYSSKNIITSQQELENQIGDLKEINREIFVKEWLESLSPDMYTTSLSWLMDFIVNDYYKFGTSKIFSIISSFIDDVKAWPQIYEWRNNVQRQKYFLNAFSREFLHLYGGYENLRREMLDIFPANELIQYEAVLDHVANHIELYDEQLVKAICIMSHVLSLEDTKELLQWALEIETTKIHPASGDSEDYKFVDGQRETFDTSVSCFIWRLLGHKDKGIRCRAAHVLLRSSLLGNVKMVEQISNLYHSELPQAYMDENNYFFVESARLWYLATCLHIGKTNALLILPLYSFFKSIAYAEGVGHALQRRIARDICLQLAPYCDLHEIDKLSVCDLCMIGDRPEKRISYYQHERKTSTQNWKFHFDTMDTLRYWYDDLAKMFACTEEEIAAECDYFVAQFGITNKKARDWSKKYLIQEDYHKTYNTQGFIPTIETMEKYAEWHSMFYVADKYRQTKTQIIDEYFSYERWLNGYLPGKDGFWCFEFRNHVPMIPFLWDFIKTVKNKPEGQYFIPSDLVSSIIDHDFGISLNMQYIARFQQSKRYIRIESAFIASENIDELVSEIKKPYTSFYDFYYQENEWRNRKKSKVIIYPTCDVITTFPDYALDKKDLLLKDYLTTSNYLMGVSDKLAKYLSVTPEEQILHARIYNVDDFPVQVYHWSEPENESGYEKHSTYGNMVSIDKECLLNILKDIKQAIIFDISISFEDDSYKFYGTPSMPAKEKILVSLEVDYEGNLIFKKQLSSSVE